MRDPAATFPLPGGRDDARDRREANQAVAVSAAGLALAGIGIAIMIWASAAFAGYENIRKAASFTWATRAAPI